MFFRNQEIIELSGGKKHIVVDNTLINDVYYYYVCEVDSDLKSVISNYKVITTVSENGHLFIKTVTGDLENKLLSIFEEKLKSE